MTIKELEKVKFHLLCHMSMEDEHSATYVSEDNRIGFCDYTPYKFGQPYGRTRRHYMLDGKWYKSRKKFFEALENYNP